MTINIEQYIEYVNAHRDELTNAFNNGINVHKLRNEAACIGVEMTPDQVKELIDLLKYSLELDL